MNLLADQWCADNIIISVGYCTLVHQGSVLDGHRCCTGIFYFRQLLRRFVVGNIFNSGECPQSKMIKPRVRRFVFALIEATGPRGTALCLPQVKWWRFAPVAAATLHLPVHLERPVKTTTWRRLPLDNGRVRGFSVVCVKRSGAALPLRDVQKALFCLHTN